MVNDIVSFCGSLRSPPAVLQMPSYDSLVQNIVAGATKVPESWTSEEGEMADVVSSCCAAEFDSAATRLQALWRGFASRTWLLDLRGPWARLATFYRVIARGHLTYDVAKDAFRCRAPGDVVRPLRSTAGGAMLEE